MTKIKANPTQVLDHQKHHVHTDWGYETSSRKWKRGRNGLHQLGQPVAPSVLFPVFKSEGEPGTLFSFLRKCLREDLSQLDSRL